MSHADVLWWATYNAALTGIMASYTETCFYASPSAEAWHFAFEAHGITPRSYHGPQGDKS